MGLAQLVSWREMPDIIGGYQVVPAALLPWSVAALIGAELLAGIWLLARSRSRNLAPVWIYTAVAAFWTLLGALAFLRGITVDNCGCFGVFLAQRLSWFTLAQDGLLLVYAGLMLRAGLRARVTGPATPVGHTVERAGTA
jgi:hypothetical protein